MIGKQMSRAVQHAAEKCTKSCDVSSRLTISTLNVSAVANSDIPELAASLLTRRYVMKSPVHGAIITLSNSQGMAMKVTVATAATTTTILKSTPRSASRCSQKLI